MARAGFEAWRWVARGGDVGCGDGGDGVGAFD
jgi:hypothetical protein